MFLFSKCKDSLAWCISSRNSNCTSLFFVDVKNHVNCKTILILRGIPHQSFKMKTMLFFFNPFQNNYNNYHEDFQRKNLNSTITTRNNMSYANKYKKSKPHMYICAKRCWNDEFIKCKEKLKQKSVISVSSHDTQELEKYIENHCRKTYYHCSLCPSLFNQGETKRERSRGTITEKLKESNLWSYGLNRLKDNEDQWPTWGYRRFFFKLHHCYEKKGTLKKHFLTEITKR